MWSHSWEKDTNKLSGKQNIMQRPTPARGKVEGSDLLLFWPANVLWVRKLMMSAWCSISVFPYTNYKHWVTLWRADSILTCNKRCSTQRDERVRAGLQVSHHVFHHSVHGLDKTADHRDGLLLNNDPTEKQSIQSLPLLSSVALC